MKYPLKDINTKDLMHGIRTLIESDSIGVIARTGLTNGFNELIRRHDDLERKVELAKRVLTMGHTERERETMNVLEGKYNHSLQGRKRRW